MNVIIEDKHIYWDNDEEKWYFNTPEDYEKAQPLSDYTKQVRKEVCEEIRKFIHSGEYDNFGIEYLRTGLAVLEKLDQIQGE